MPWFQKPCKRSRCPAEQRIKLALLSRGPQCWCKRPLQHLIDRTSPDPKSIQKWVWLKTNVPRQLAAIQKTALGFLYLLVPPRSFCFPHFDTKNRTKNEKVSFLFAAPMSQPCSHQPALLSQPHPHLPLRRCRSSWLKGEPRVRWPSMQQVCVSKDGKTVCEPKTH